MVAVCCGLGLCSCQNDAVQSKPKISSEVKATERPTARATESIWLLCLQKIFRLMWIQVIEKDWRTLGKPIRTMLRFQRCNIIIMQDFMKILIIFQMQKMK